MSDCICKGFYINPNCLVCGYKSKTDSIEKLRNENNELFRKLKNQTEKIQELEAFKKEALEIIDKTLGLYENGAVSGLSDGEREYQSDLYEKIDEFLKKHEVKE